MITLPLLVEYFATFNFKCVYEEVLPTGVVSDQISDTNQVHGREHFVVLKHSDTLGFITLFQHANGYISTELFFNWLPLDVTDYDKAVEMDDVLIGVLESIGFDKEQYTDTIIDLWEERIPCISFYSSKYCHGLQVKNLVVLFEFFKNNGIFVKWFESQVNFPNLIFSHEYKQYIDISNGAQRRALLTYDCYQPRIKRIQKRVNEEIIITY